jgi:hypothetical protein
MKSDNFMFRYSIGALLLVCLVALGCSRNVSVTGTVTFSDNGEPVKFGMVLFTGEKNIGRGVIKDGKYSIGLARDGEGIPPGTYTVSSNMPWTPYVPLPPPISDPAQTVQQVPQEQQEYYTTKEPKTIEVKKSMTYDFQVEREKPGVPNVRRR